MNKLCLNSVDRSIFRVNGETQDARAEILAEGRALFFEHARRGKEALLRANGSPETAPAAELTPAQYTALNRTFQREHLLYAARVACEATHEPAPKDWDSFKAQGQRFFNSKGFWATLAGIYTEIVNPILPAVYSEAVDVFADTVEVGFGETYELSISSTDIPVFQDSAWGSSWSVPANRFYSRDYTINPQPKTCMIVAKWHQLVGNNVDFGRFFANLTAGMYAKTLAMWNDALATAAADTTLVPTGLTGTFSNVNFVTLANKVAALNSTQLGNLFATGGLVALSKVLPTQVTGSTNVNMDAAIATLLGADYTRSGYLGEFMGVRLLPLMDAIVPNSQFTSVQTVLNQNQIWIMAANARKPMTIGYTAETPISLEIEPTRNAAFEVGINLTIALDVVSIFSQKAAILTI